MSGYGNDSYGSSDRDRSSQNDNSGSYGNTDNSYGGNNKRDADSGNDDPNSYGSNTSADSYGSSNPNAGSNDDSLVTALTGNSTQQHRQLRLRQHAGGSYGSSNTSSDNSSGGQGNNASSGSGDWVQKGVEFAAQKAGYNLVRRVLFAHSPSRQLLTSAFDLQDESTATKIESGLREGLSRFTCMCSFLRVLRLWLTLTSKDVVEKFRTYRILPIGGSFEGNTDSKTGIVYQDTHVSNPN
ncbi:hypothetical protein BN946_scf184786.g7 [Trametes cinnabarina]|uniref:Uncharacterized protein n=1 Tax=Pycnoporus cinnabarinus TaxID=5643 RepID=A0A060STA1_PYCCI|nr:hypothetical protein BN946_scf184786.g7 [Trametes cinnabarina]